MSAIAEFHDDVKASTISHSKTLNDMAKLLVKRHLEVSNKGCPKLSEILPREMRKKIREHPSRVIAVVGTGPSQHIVPGVSDIKKELVKHDRINEGLKEELRRLTLAYGLDENAFETVMSACSRTYDLELIVRRILAEQYSIRQPTILSYEILAHLMKHRYIDAIITFNFDELLDQSIDDELGITEYVKIISDRDCDSVETDPDSTDYKPIYLKLHGTASDPESLKFTRDAYFAHREKIASTISELLGRHECSIFVVGSAMQSFEFNYLLNSPKRLNIFNFSKTPLRPDVVKEIKNTVRKDPKGIRTPIKNIINRKGLGKYRLHDADLLLYAMTQKLSRQASALTNDNLSFRPVLRHLLVTQICGRFPRTNNAGTYKRLLRECYQTRAILEVAFSGIKGRGVLSIDPLAKDRCARYFDLYKSQHKKFKSWREICRLGGLIPHWESQDTYVPPLNLRVSGTETNEWTNPIYDIDKLTDRLDRTLSGTFERRIFKDRRVLIREVLKMLGQGTEIEYQTNDFIVYSKMYKNPKILHMQSALHASTVDMLENEDYDEIWITAETGEWILRPQFRRIIKNRIRNGSLTIKLIVAFMQHIRKLNNTYKGHLEYKWIPWYRHNRHITLISHQKELKKGIHMTRRLRSPFVTPIYLNDEFDLCILRNAFNNYWNQAPKKQPSIP